MSDINRLSITAENQWLSSVKGGKWYVPMAPGGANALPAFGIAMLSFAIIGSMTDGTKVTLKRRVRAEFNGGSSGSEVVIRAFTSATTDDVYPVNDRFEYDLGVAIGDWHEGDTVAVELV